MAHHLAGSASSTSRLTTFNLPHHQTLRLTTRSVTIPNRSNCRHTRSRCLFLPRSPPVAPATKRCFGGLAVDRTPVPSIVRVTPHPPPPHQRVQSLSLEMEESLLNQSVVYTALQSVDPDDPPLEAYCQQCRKTKLRILFPTLSQSCGLCLTKMANRRANMRRKKKEALRAGLHKYTVVTIPVVPAVLVVPAVPTIPAAPAALTISAVTVVPTIPAVPVKALVEAPVSIKVQTGKQRHSPTILQNGYSPPDTLDAVTSLVNSAYDIASTYPTPPDPGELVDAEAYPITAVIFKLHDSFQLGLSSGPVSLLSLLDAGRDHPGSLKFKEIGKNIALAIVPGIQAASGSGWTYQKGFFRESDRSWTHTFICSSSLESLPNDRKKPTTPSPNESLSKKRHGMCRNRWDCGGRIRFTVGYSGVSIHHRHRPFHPGQRDRNVPLFVRNFIRNMIHCDAAETYRQFLYEFRSTTDSTLQISQKQVYYWWSVYQRGRWYRDFDDFKSSQALLAALDRDGFQVIHPITEERISLAWTVPFWRDPHVAVESSRHPYIRSLPL